VHLSAEAQGASPVLMRDVRGNRVDLPIGHRHGFEACFSGMAGSLKD
jgi:hypothetical protein